MRLLLDTHSYLWWISSDRRLTAAARSAISDPASTVHVSAATVWEAIIKASAGRLDVRVDLVEHIAVNGFEELPISARHAALAGSLPRLHGDAFDRMLVAQATLEDLTLVTHDSDLAQYGVEVLLT